MKLTLFICGNLSAHEEFEYVSLVIDQDDEVEVVKPVCMDYVNAVYPNRIVHVKSTVCEVCK